MVTKTIPELFRGQHVLITGGTGFMGKVLIEKLIRCCPEIEKIYIIVRARRGKCVKERIDELKQLPVFELLPKRALEEKLVALEGNLMKPRLGLSDSDYQYLCTTVTSIFHVAASVRFNDPLDEAVKLNTIATKELVDMALLMPKLLVFLHVSTAYCNCHLKGVIEEVVYPGIANWKDTVNVVNNIDQGVLNILSTKYLGPMPNTYTFSKNLAEQIVWEQKDRLPIVIFRPSIVVSSWKEPVPGWADNLNGPIGILIGYGTGVVRTTIIDDSVRPDYVAVDSSINAMISAAWARSENISEITVYNASSVNSVTNRDLIEMATQGVQEMPFMLTLWPHTTHTTMSKTRFKIDVWLKHVLPALLVDSFLKLTGKKPRLMDIHIKYYLAIKALCYFTTNCWNFNNLNFLQLNDKILPEDKKSFDYDCSAIVPREYFRLALIGARKYILHEDDALLPQAKVQVRRLIWLDRIARCVFWVLIAWFIINLNVTQRVTQRIATV